MRRELLDLLLRARQAAEEPVFVREKKFALLAQLAKRQFLQRYPELLPDLLHVWQSGYSDHVELVLLIIRCGNAFSWSAPIPVQTRSSVGLKVNVFASATSSVSRATNDENDRNAVYCVLITSEKDMRTVSVTEPFVLVNKLHVPLTYRVRSAFSSAYGSGTSDSPSEPKNYRFRSKDKYLVD
ncbi:hypothetical protein PsorP6_003897 [Peronosclerospora sorghi]|uniref:Uncharacterized protein n=1 Tax=Peronosclerospora sorghi TaxID=230839 RepID=A0ACC0VRN8_9STRA|nr:hypothetical protein PsorP6_003897 [Peronosclerospora sorghi]